MRKNSRKRGEIIYTPLNCGCCVDRDERQWYRTELVKKELLTLSVTGNAAHSECEESGFEA